MKTEDLVNALRAIKVETGSLACMGCGHEHGCGIHGCAIMNAAADRLEELAQGLPQWIPVTESLPGNEHSRVLVHLTATVPQGGEPKVDTDRYCNGMWVRWSGRVTHWMPLPFGLEEPEQEASPWISVKDRLPDVGERVLTLSKWGHVSDRTLRLYLSGGIYFSPDGLTPGVDVKYWMPLPNLPGHGVVKKTEGSHEA